MSKKILIDTSSDDEIRVAVTENGKIDDFEIENEKKNAVKGDVYLAKITRVEPSLQAAFVDYGANKHGFLPLTEIHPDYFKIPSTDQKNLKELSSNLHLDDEIESLKKDDSQDEIIEKNKIENEDDDLKKNKEDLNKIVKKNIKKNYLNFFKKYKIQDVIKPKQVILVQINKEERSLKGAALTTYLSFAGRYCVLMPNSLNNMGISKKIVDSEERQKLKSILTGINVPEKMSVIIRTAGIGKTKKEISKDFNFLISQWNKIREKTLKSAAPILIYEEGNIIKRTIRDLLTSDVDDVFIEGKDGYELAKKYTKTLVPQKLKNIKLFKGQGTTLFNENDIEHQINDLFSLKVNLQSGGSLIINTTEALVAIDVNSGKNTSERNIENTALKTNIEAANEVARQLRLRDLGGLVVIDFIDMDDYRNNFKVEKTIKAALHRDRAKIQVGRISMFGLLELSRQRLRSSLIERSFDKCYYCNGSGIILNNASISEQIIRGIKEKISVLKGQKIKVKCNSALAENLINIKREEINFLEKNYESTIEFSFDNYFSLHEPIIEIIDDKKISNNNSEKVLQPKKKINFSKKITKKNESKKKQSINKEEGKKLEDNKDEKNKAKPEKKLIKKKIKLKKKIIVKKKIVIKKKNKAFGKEDNKASDNEDVLIKDKEKVSQDDKSGWWSDQ